MYGPPGTGKTLMARACAAQTKGILLGSLLSWVAAQSTSFEIDIVGYAENRASQSEV